MGIYAKNRVTLSFYKPGLQTVMEALNVQKIILHSLPSITFPVIIDHTM
jgi:hypothetical protein